MPSPADEPLARCDINLYQRDKEYLERRFGRGWSEQVRLWVREKINQQNAPTFTPATGKITYDK